MDIQQAKEELGTLLPKMWDNFKSKELSYMDYQDNLGDGFTADRLFLVFKKHRDAHNGYVEQLKELRTVIKDDEFVDKEIEKVRSS